MNPTLPDQIIIRATGSHYYDGLAVWVTFGMCAKNNFHYLAYLNAEGCAEFGKSEYLARFDLERGVFIADYTDPRITFSGTIGARIKTQADLNHSLKAFELYHKHFSYPEGHKANLEKALALLSEHEIAIEKMSVTVEQVTL